MRAARRVGPATVRAAEGAMEWGKHFKTRPPNKDDAFPREWAEQGKELRRPCIGYNERCPGCEARGTEGRILFEPARAGVPHLSALIFESWAPPTPQFRSH